MARNEEQLDLLPKQQNRDPAAAPAATASQAALTSQAATAGKFDAERAADLAANPSIYGGAYDQQINDAYRAVTGRAPFQYNLDGDALYQSYKDRYIQNAKRSMKDTMGQAAGLTGGYGSSYGQAVGQQMYDETMRGLTDMIPELEQRAYGRWQDEGDRLLQQYQMLNQMGAADQATRENAYQKLAQAIMTAGHIPNQEELIAAGMNSETANKYLMQWMTANPDAAYMMGALNPAQYFQLTGKNPNGYVDPNAAAAGGYYGGGGGPKNPDEPETEPETQGKPLTQREFDRWLGMMVTRGYLNEEKNGEATKIREDYSPRLVGKVIDLNTLEEVMRGASKK